MPLLFFSIGIYFQLILDLEHINNIG
uniref:Uncharacterized protein n=1 Tax=Rhizophora mucronata TaxID=61149 RepID=A0A2P2QM43_RHIMU